MTDLETDAHAEGVLKHLQTVSTSPLDGISILGVALLKVYDSSRATTWPIESFAQDFKESLIASWRARSSDGSDLLQ